MKNILSKLLFLFVSLMFFWPEAYSQPSNPEQNQPNYDEILRLAEQGIAPAQSYLGYMYVMGQGVPQSYSEAFKWFRNAAEQGDSMAQSQLGTAYVEGFGVNKDYEEAAKWFHKAAEQGNKEAQHSLGFMYTKEGYGVIRDYKEAVKWYRKAAEQGYADAQHNLAGMYYQGKGVTKDDILAYMWCTLASTSLTGEAREKAIVNRDHLSQEMTPEQIDEAQRLAQEWKPNPFRHPQPPE